MTSRDVMATFWELLIVALLIGGSYLTFGDRGAGIVMMLLGVFAAIGLALETKR